MKTDAAFFELVESNPDWLTELSNLSLPKFRGASSQTMKTTEEISADFLLEPVNESDPYFTSELQLYFDHSSYNRAELSRCMVWRSLNSASDCRLKSYTPRKVKGLIIFGDRDCLPPDSNCHPDIECLFLDKLIADLRERDPESPLVAVLAPLVDSEKTLEKEASRYYAVIQTSENLTSDEREVMVKVFLHFMTQIFTDLTTKQLQDMISQLPPIEETRVGRELIGKGREEGREEGREDIVIALARSRFSDFTEIHESQIRDLDCPQLTKLAISLLDFETVKDLEEWLKSC